MPASPPFRPLAVVDRLTMAWLVFLAPGVTLFAQEFFMPAAPPGLGEAGTPTFLVLPPGTLGLSSQPTDMERLPDGRLVVIAPQEIAIGDGARWSAFRQRPGPDQTPLNQVVVDQDGQLYAAILGGFARIEFGEDAQWGLVSVATFPDLPEIAGRVLSRVSAVGDTWYWYAGSGAIVTWRPGRPATVLGHLNDVERVLSAGAETLIGDGSTGAIVRVRGNHLEPVGDLPVRQVDRALTSSVSLPTGDAILGTNNAGALRFDGQTFTRLAHRGPLAGGHRINDLCPTAGGFLCAALDNFGLVFFDADGRVVQVLDRSVDHRLARARRLLNLPGGTVCALLQEGVALVQFPSRVSFFEPLISTGLVYAEPTRHAGHLWMLADGKAQRGIYDADGRLLRFEIDSPAPWVSTIIAAGDRLLLATAQGIFQREGDSWRHILPDVRDAHLTAAGTGVDRWLVVAYEKVGWLRPGADGGLVFAGVPVPDLGISYGTHMQVGDVYWAELGTGRVARILDRDGRLDVRVFTGADGLPDGWVQTFQTDGIARFNIAGRIFRYDAPADRIIADPEFIAQTRGLVSEHGRPARDARGRLWLTTRDTVAVIDDQHESGDSLEHLPRGFAPIRFTMEEGGVVWMHQRQRMVRFDPAMPEAAPATLRAVIGQVHLVTSDRTITTIGVELPALDAWDSSLGVRFFAPHAPLDTPVTFEVRLEGAGTAWVPTGTAGVASFAQLPEGHYVLHVRPRAGTVTGEATAVGFTIHPPWFRTPLAYTAYVVGTLGLLLAIGLGWSYLSRREKIRLARLVTERTAELRSSEEKIRRLNEDLEQRVATRTAELNLTNDRLLESNRELEAFSYSVSHDLRTPLRNIRGFADLLRRRSSQQLDAEGNRYVSIVSTETARLGQLIDSLLTFSRLNQAELHREAVDPTVLIASVRAELATDCAGRNIEWRIEPLPPITGDPTLLRQVFANLLGNAVKFTRGRDPAVITIGSARVARFPGETTYFIRDNGAGFDPKYSNKLFGVFQRLHGGKDFEGSGIGLAIVRRIIARHGGHTWAEGAPEGGATFSFSLPQPSQRSGPNAS